VRADLPPKTIRITTGPITIDPAKGAAGLALTYGIGHLSGTAIG
jgi:hypothetical protein